MERVAVGQARGWGDGHKTFLLLLSDLARHILLIVIRTFVQAVYDTVHAAWNVTCPENGEIYYSNAVGHKYNHHGTNTTAPRPHHCHQVAEQQPEQRRSNNVTRFVSVSLEYLILFIISQLISRIPYDDTIGYCVGNATEEIFLFFRINKFP